MCMKNPNPHWEDENSSVDGYWDHPEHGKWALYSVEESDGVHFYEFRENNKQPHKPSNNLKELAGDKYQERVKLLKKNRKVYRSAKGGFGRDPYL